MTTHIFFDLDNTLIDRDQCYQEYLHMFFKQSNNRVIWNEYKHEILKKDNHGYTPRSVFERYLTKHFIDRVLFDNYQKKYVVGDFVEPISLILKQKLNCLQEKYKIGILTNGSIINQETKIKKATSILCEVFASIQ